MEIFIGIGAVIVVVIQIVGVLDLVGIFEKKRSGDQG